MKKKLLSFILAICLLIPCALALSACGESDSTAKVMNVSLNPKLEFVLDKDDMVDSVNALNDDGNHIISLATNNNEKFEDISAEEALALFLEIAEENGYLITGNEEEITIEVSGDADKLLRKAKDKAKEFFEDNNLSIDIVTGKIKKSDIVNEVKNCMREYTDAELNKMSEEELIGMLKDSRKETSELLTQELKETYYNLRLEKINIAELESLLSVINDLTDSSNVLLQEFVSNMETLKDDMALLEDAYTTYYLSETSAYNVAKDAYVTAKETLLAKRLELGQDGSISEDDKSILTNYETAVSDAKKTLKDAKDAADDAIQSAKDAVQSILNTLKTSLDEIKTILSSLGVNLEEVNNAKNHVKENFKNQFSQHENFGPHVGKDKSHWNMQQPNE